MKKFVKTIEDFICEHCGFEVKGSGYTNHCPNCLWSKHVDINPGDRGAMCKGMMKPIRIDGDTSQGYKVVQICDICGHIWNNSLAANDNFEEVMRIVNKNVAK